LQQNTEEREDKRKAEDEEDCVDKNVAPLAGTIRRRRSGNIRQVAWNDRQHARREETDDSGGECGCYIEAVHT
jgi:hypothetical protein